jgi:hypothetical protein
MVGKTERQDQNACSEDECMPRFARIEAADTTDE